MKEEKRERFFTRALRVPMILWAIAFVLMALVYVIGLSFRESDGVMGATGKWTLANYQALTDKSNLRVLGNSMLLALKTMGLCLIIGYPFGYLMARGSKTRRMVLMLLGIVPFCTNALIRIYTLIILLYNYGPISRLLEWLGLTNGPTSILYTQSAVLLGMVYALLPFMILPSFTAAEKMDYTLVEASRDLGASPFKSFFSVILPQTAPGMLTGCVLVLVPAMGLFFLSDLLGGAKTVLLGNRIQDAYSRRHNLPLASSLSVLFLAISALLLMLHRRLSGGNASLM